MRQEKVYKRLYEAIKADKDSSEHTEPNYFKKENDPPISKSYFYALKKMAEGETPPYKVQLNTILTAWSKLGYKVNTTINIEGIGELTL